jgi:opacity protein-like surface antigen
MKKLNIAILTLIVSQNVNAFTVINSTSGASAANYGNAQTPEFRNAIEGNNEGITPEEEQKILSSIPIKFNNNWYVGFRNNWFDYKLSSFSNKSNAPLDSISIPQNTYKHRSKPPSFMVGYMFDGFSAEGELIIGSKLNTSYSFEPYGSGSLTVKNRTFFINGYWDFIDLAGIKPFFMGGVGAAQNKATSELSVSGIKTDNTRYAFAWNVGFGVRFRVVSHFFIEAMARYIRNGEVEVKEKSLPDFKIRSKLSSQGYNLGLIVVF